MKIINNGEEKNIEVLKHFKLDTDEYILYKYNEQIGIGFIKDNKITIPDSDKMDSIKKIIANFISSNPSDLINSQYKCITLSNNIDESLEEISVQHIKLTDEQIANLTHKKDLSNYTYRPMYANYKEKRETSIVSIIVVLILLIIVAVIGVKLKEIIKSDKPQTNKKKTTNVEVIKPEEAFNKAINYEIKGDATSMLNLISTPMKRKYSSYITKDVFTAGAKTIKDEIGDNIKVKSDIKSTKIDDNIIEEMNLDFHETIGYDVTLKECYNYTGSVKLTGSIKEKIYTPDTSVLYCKINDEWGFIFENIDKNILLISTIIPKQVESKTTNTEIKKLEEAYKILSLNDYNKFISITPKAMREFIKKEIPETAFKTGLNQIFKDIGTNITITSNLTTNKKDAAWLKQNNELFKQKIGNNINIEECFEYHGTITIKGSKSEKILTDKELNNTFYCKVNGEWGFIFG